MRSRMRWRRLVSRSSRAAIWAKVERKSGWDPTSWTSVVAHPASEAMMSSSMSRTVLPTPRSPEKMRLRSAPPAARISINEANSSRSRSRPAR